MYLLGKRFLLHYTRSHLEGLPQMATLVYNPLNFLLWRSSLFSQSNDPGVLRRQAAQPGRHICFRSDMTVEKSCHRGITCPHDRICWIPTRYRSWAASS